MQYPVQTISKNQFVRIEEIVVKGTGGTLLNTFTPTLASQHKNEWVEIMNNLGIDVGNAEQLSRMKERAANEACCGLIGRLD